MHDIENICNKYYNIVFKYLIDLTHNVNLSEELTQETFCIAIKEINKFKGECAVSSWLCVIAKHLYYRKYKEIKKFKLEELNENEVQELSIDERFLEKEERIELYRQLQNLDEKTRDLMYLRLLGFSFKEISEIIGKNETWCKVVYHRGKNKLEDFLKGGNTNGAKRKV